MPVAQADGSLAPDPPSILPLRAPVAKTDTEKVFEERVLHSTLR